VEDPTMKRSPVKMILIVSALILFPSICFAEKMSPLGAMVKHDVCLKAAASENQAGVNHCQEGIDGGHFPDLLKNCLQDVRDKYDIAKDICDSQYEIDVHSEE
jgi:hypothetical protein